MRIRLRIESLIVEGLMLGPHQEPALRAALTAELAGLFASGGNFQPSCHACVIARMPEPAVGRPEPLCRQIGRAIHGSVLRHAQ